MVREWVCCVRVRRPFVCRSFFVVLNCTDRLSVLRLSVFVCAHVPHTTEGIIQIFEKQLKVRQKKPRTMRMDYHAVTRPSTMTRDAVMTIYDQLSHLDACGRRVATNDTWWHP